MGLFVFNPLHEVQEITIKSDAKSLNRSGSVRWCHEMGDNIYKVGLEFFDKVMLGLFEGGEYMDCGFKVKVIDKPTGISHITEPNGCDGYNEVLPPFLKYNKLNKNNDCKYFKPKLPTFFQKIKKTLLKQKVSR